MPSCAAPLIELMNVQVLARFSTVAMPCVIYYTVYISINVLVLDHSGPFEEHYAALVKRGGS